MRPHLKCGLCILKWIFERIANEDERLDIQHKIFMSILHLLFNKIEFYTNLGELCNEALTIVEEYIESRSTFWKNLKKNTNENVMEILPKAKLFVDSKKSEDEKLEYAFYFAACANVAPIAAPSSNAYIFPEIMNIIENNSTTMVYTKGDVFEAVDKSKNVFYLTDNAGEIGFDSLLIEEFKKKGKKVVLVVKDKLFFEDATLEDALSFRLHKICDEIVTVDKFFIPHKAKKLVNEAFHYSDLIICKGTGNYESLSGEKINKKIIFLLRAKCNPIAQEVGVKENYFIIKSVN